MGILNNIFDKLYPLKGTSSDIENFQKSEPVDKILVNSPALFQDAYDTPFSPVLDLGSWSFKTSKNLDYTLQQFRCDLNSFYLEEPISELIDYAVGKIAPISNIYTKHLDFADTDINVKIKIKGRSLKKSQEIYLQSREKIARLYPDCYTDRDVSSYVLGYLLRYGVFCSQKWFDPKTNSLESIQIIPPYQIRWKNIEELAVANSKKTEELFNQGYNYFKSWLPYQKSPKNGDVYIHPKGFLYKPLTPLVTDKGKFFIPPLLGAIANVPSYQMFNKSLEDVGRNVGYHKQLRAVTDSDALKVLGENPNQTVTQLNSQTNKSEEIPLVSYVYQAANKIKKLINEHLKVAVMAVPPGVKIEEGSSFDVPKSLQDLKDLILSEIIIGGKSYFNIVGYPGQVNQTTLASTQKQVLKNQIESLQAANLSIYKHDTFAQLASDGYVVEEWEASHEPPVFDTSLESENARKIKLENDSMEEASKKGKISQEDKIQKARLDEK